jgi:sorbitol/mannitol transport system permease protein
MSIRKKIIRQIINILSILLALLFAFPVIYMFISGFKSESLVTTPTLIFTPTLQNYKDVITPDMLLYLRNSVIITLVTVIVSITLAVPASYAIAFSKFKKKESNDNIYFWFITTILLPAVSVIIPVYLIFTKTGLLDTQIGLVLLYLGMGVPLMIWMVTIFFKDIPKEILEASYIDGSSKAYTFFKILLPLVKTGIVSSALLVFVTIWNEFFFAVSMSYSNAPTLPVYMSKYMTQQGFFWGKMCAVSTLVVIIPIVLGLCSQKAFVKGMTMGAVKG